MTPALAIVLFLASAALTFAAAGFFAQRLDHVGPRLGLPEAVVGLVTAVAADAPEISSALVALERGEKQVSLGVVLGSNVFNLAAMVGLAAVLTGGVRLRRNALVLEGAVGLLATCVAAALVLGWLPAWATLLLFVAILAPYLALSVHGSGNPLDERPARRRRRPDETALWKSLSLIVPAVALIVAGSTGMVRGALVLAGDWHVSKQIVGILVLAVLTSLPNAYTAIRLGLERRGAALVSETIGSNTINLVGGLLLPALVVGLAAPSGIVDVDLVWLLGMTAVTLLLLAPRRGVGMRGGALLIALYAVFVVVQVVAQ